MLDLGGKLSAPSPRGPRADQKAALLLLAASASFSFHLVGLLHLSWSAGYFFTLLH
jgi:hypothetical protein